MSDSKTEPRPLREVADSLRKAAYEHGGDAARKAAEKHIDKAVRELDRKRNG